MMIGGEGERGLKHCTIIRSEPQEIKQQHDDDDTTTFVLVLDE